ncbi:NAD-dependent epimerase/dehydratase family protein [Amycolatopsis oliviviridis]|uniref:UDP-glucose 4-epimerase n=1 Tax=Amycolatopsis oliviviridis TaxID=1471590 RepID=A0ABQ3LBA2_9PSEU|nr:NAD-dependent epimerase/dehydratase family protein [Amycolatopsis oliviviridis]GHH05316.1 UDP-glucose 4-epimerase [Amycolatopsis oliviviridis]
MVPSFSPANEPLAAVIGADGSLGARLVRALWWKGVPTLGYTAEHPAMRGSIPDPDLLGVDVVFFVPDRMSPAVAERDPDRVSESIAELRVLLTVLSVSGRRPVVVLEGSGGTVYDATCEPPYAELTAVNPTTAYGRAKLEQEEALAAAVDGIAPVVLRVANFYGPGQRTSAGYGVVGHWMEAALAGEPLRILGHGGSRRDYIHIADVTSAMLAVLRRAPAFRADKRPVVLNIGSGESTSLNELHRQFEAVVGRTLVSERDKARSFDRQDSWLDVRRAAEVLGWRPRITLADGLADTWRSYLARHERDARARTGNRAAGPGG